MESNDWLRTSHIFSELDTSELVDMVDDICLAVDRTENERQVQVLEKVMGRLSLELAWRQSNSP